MITPASSARTTTLLTNLFAVTSRISAAAASAASTSTSSASTTKTAQQPQPRLIAVSKLKPASDILALHSPPTSHLHFGENYLQELLEKSRLLPPTIRWHFIGGLQSNKCVLLAREVRGLWAVESVDSEKKASLLDKGWGERKYLDPNDVEEKEKKLRVFVQVNTSGEENKAGIEPDAAPGLCRFIKDKCSRLQLQGVMTIGAIARSKATTPENENEDFICLRETRDRIVKELGLKELELSMGMSEDFEGAIALGSDEVRVGTTIFGDRPPKSEARIV
ncbi:hypothetical protein SI65_02463 [Aspergillus cristatus]|uniref:Pyridoxal phosphate homeostasis protein n=1 Tax=Aspergillus cristatus TaxID=573508 RepID=A0A1E3BL01_ASPCR|nr:hypothetical protein SI65_02463 [Aspergillus cristatus]